MLCRYMITVLCENDMKLQCHLWAEPGILNVKPGGTSSNDWALNG